MSVDYEEITDTTQLEAVDELPLPVVEQRFADIFCRNPAAVSMFTGTAEDIETEGNAAIIAAAYQIKERNAPGGVNVANLAEILAVPEIELRKRAMRARSDIMSEFESYAARILAESYRRKMLNALSAGHAQVARTKWRDMEITGPNIVRSVGTVNHSGHKVGKNDAGNVLKSIRESAAKGVLPRALPMPWDAMNVLLEEGLREYKKMYIVAPEGSRKSTILYNIILFLALNGYRHNHFALDGGSVEEQMVKITAILWYQLLIKHKVVTDVMVDTGHGYSDYMFARKRTVWKLLTNQDPGFDVPPDALELFWEADTIMDGLTRTGKAPGRLTFVTARECRGDIMLMRSILNSESNGDGIDCWSFDHMGKLHGKGNDPMQAVHEVVMHLHTFTDEEGPPMIGLSQMNQESIRDLGRNRSGIMRYGQEAQQDADYVILSMFDPKSPEVLPLTTPKNRDEGSANPILRIQPESGYIYEAAEEI